MENLNDFKIMLTAGIAAVMGLLGWQGVLLLGWVVLMLIDYISGSLAANHPEVQGSLDAFNVAWGA